jgi:hypothetical protein
MTGFSPKDWVTVGFSVQENGTLVDCSCSYKSKTLNAVCCLFGTTFRDVVINFGTWHADAAAAMTYTAERDNVSLGESEQLATVRSIWIPSRTVDKI